MSVAAVPSIVETKTKVGVFHQVEILPRRLAVCTDNDAHGEGGFTDTIVEVDKRPSFDGLIST